MSGYLAQINEKPDTIIYDMTRKFVTLGHKVDHIGRQIKCWTRMSQSRSPASPDAPLSAQKQK